ncbi:hypothetical protein LguiA_002051 [Lonicera macranthoides]
MENRTLAEEEKRRQSRGRWKMCACIGLLTSLVNHFDIVNIWCALWTSGKFAETTLEVAQMVRVVVSSKRVGFESLYPLLLEHPILIHYFVREKWRYGNGGGCVAVVLLIGSGVNGVRRLRDEVVMEERGGGGMQYCCWRVLPLLQL